MLIRLSFLLLVVVSAGIFFIIQHLERVHIPAYGFGTPFELLAQARGHEGTILFFGDVMLGRAVETLMEDRGTAYPFHSVAPLARNADVTVANFEAAIPEEHAQTENFDMQLSVRQEYLGQLLNSGFSVLSLANNHALDFGESGLQHTRAACSYYTLECIGHPRTIDLSSITYHTFGDTRIGVLALNATEENIDEMSLGALLAKMDFYSDIQTVFVHWGIEYEEVHAKTQETLAHALINAGADAVIGHHPHVVQDIELYNGKPIFYSLGNLIFDQYFDDAVQTGLAVNMAVHEDIISYRLIGLSSAATPSQPAPLASKANHDFLAALAERSDETLKEAVRAGEIVVTR